MIHAQTSPFQPCLAKVPYLAGSSASAGSFSSINNLTGSCRVMQGICILDAAARIPCVVQTSGAIISQSTPHLYLSGLPFAPIQSKISRQLPQYPSRVFGLCRTLASKEHFLTCSSGTLYRLQSCQIEIASRPIQLIEQCGYGTRRTGRLRAYRSLDIPSIFARWKTDRLWPS
ncbi:hypothetical protein P692DRAFT_20935707 [Suillus brevipes Sb2]|nr:hypothetical protein P692DRAFT_201899471 [Suillus brevipes Sb2]KAG2746984.1 hypothetical protein P692DRAFT_20935707 [Suillus brevipes Sb2]